ncbi:hypothetical protein [Dictyobacter kobayashii]|uniref:hypothetical protein n=1 Tax=Dictyobacter kobayashii TaxID=2014872 RepID=UPI001C3FE5C7|nr:hypothetical protein [Dictyobacter kobayashii]
MVSETRRRQIVGRPEVVREKLLDLVQQTGADELMISAMMYGHENRSRAFELLASAFQLPSATENLTGTANEQQEDTLHQVTSL